MTSRHRWRLGSIAIMVAMVNLLVAAAACSNSSDETVDLLKDPKVGQAISRQGRRHQRLAYRP